MLGFDGVFLLASPYIRRLLIGSWEVTVAKGVAAVKANIMGHSGASWSYKLSASGRQQA